MRKHGRELEIYIIYILASWLLLGVIVTCADQFSSKSPGLTSIPTITSFEQVEEILREHARSIDYAYRGLHADIDDINRDEIPTLEDSITALDIPIDFDVPMVKNCNFRYVVAGAHYIHWDAGTLTYAGVEYTVVDTGSPAFYTDGNDTAVYVDVSSLTGTTVEFGHTDDPTVVADRWYLAIRVGTTVYEAVADPIQLGGLIQANTVTATQIAVDTIFATDITMTGTDAELHSYLKDAYATDATEGFWMGYDSATGDPGWKFDIGDATDYMRWTGGDVEIAGSITIQNPGDITTASLDNAAGTFTDDTAADTAQGTADGAVTTANANDTTLDDWSYSGSADRTTINGGDIETGTVAAAKINTTDLFVSNDVIIGNYAGGKGVFWDQSETTFDIKGDVTCNTLTANTIVDLGDTGSAEGVQVVSAGSDAQIKVRRLSTYYYQTVWDKTGFNHYQDISAYSTDAADKTFELDVIGVAPMVRVKGGIVTDHYFGSDSDWTCAMGDNLQVRDVRGSGGNLLFIAGKNVSGGNPGAVLGYDASTKIAVDSSGVVAVKAASLTGVIGIANIPDISGRSVSGFTSTKSLTLWAATTAVIKATSPAAGTMAYVTDDATPRPVFYDGSAWRYVSSNNKL